LITGRADRLSAVPIVDGGFGKKKQMKGFKQTLDSILEGYVLKSFQIVF
jgi:hypothetical protein